MQQSGPVNRRQFLAGLTAGALVPSLVSSGQRSPTVVSTSDGTAAPTRRIERIGLQLYTVRAEMARDVEATLARVAQIGYTEVEFAGYFTQPPHVIRALLARNGLTAPAAHIPYATLTGDWQKALDDSATIGHQYVVIPFLDEPTRSRPDGWSRLADEFNRAARLAQAAGLKFAYHNHQFEFIDLGRTSPFELLLEKCDPALVGFELDLFWATVGGQDPVQLFERHPGRFPLVHVKDMIAMPARQEGELMVPSDRAFTQLTDVGRGSIDWARIFARSTVAGIRHYFVEHDHPTAAFDSIANSFRYLREVRY